MNFWKTATHFPNHALEGRAVKQGSDHEHARVSHRCAARLLIVLCLSSVTALAGPQDLLALMQRITALAKEGRYAEAATLARKLESEAEKASGPQSPLTATTLVVLAQTLQT
jgi:hypothetical protein